MTGLFRLSRIVKVLFSERIDAFLPAPKSGPLKLIAWCIPKVRTKKARGERLRDALQTLGPVFVKFGQMLSTRRDLLPPDIAGALADLQDRVKPFSGDAAQAIIERDLQSPIMDIFSTFSVTPMASASVAQVHAATLHDGREVVVKVIRPGIEKVIEEDLKLMMTLARFVEKNFEDGKRLKLVQVVSDYRMTILDELDLQREAANTALIRRNFEGSTICYVPEIYWDYTRRNVMVEERVYGVPISQVDVLKAHHVNMEKLAERGVEIFFTQVFDHSFFHADMHPGNVFIDITDPENPVYKAIDFGIVGTLDPESQSYLAQNLIAFFDRDYRAVAGGRRTYLRGRSRGPRSRWRPRPGTAVGQRRHRQRLAEQPDPQRHAELHRLLLLPPRGLRRDDGSQSRQRRLPDHLRGVSWREQLG